MKNITNRYCQSELVVQVHIAHFENLHECTIRCLHADEKKTYLLKKRDISRQQFIASRVFTKFLYASEHQPQWLHYKLAYSEQERQVCLTKDQDVLGTFSLSHSGSWVALLDCQHSLGGIDIQMHNKSPEQLRRLGDFLNDADKPLVSKHVGRFYSLWAAKEAFAKLSGKSIFDLLSLPHYELWKRTYLTSFSKPNEWNVGICLESHLPLKINFWQVSWRDFTYHITPMSDLHLNALANFKKK